MCVPLSLQIGVSALFCPRHSRSAMGRTTTDSLEATMNATSAPSSAVGVLLTDESLYPVWFKSDATQIPSKASDVTALGERIRASFGKQSLRSPALAEFTSGRRRYFCRAFLLKP